MMRFKFDWVMCIISFAILSLRDYFAVWNTLLYLEKRKNGSTPFKARDDYIVNISQLLCSILIYYNAH